MMRSLSVLVFCLPSPVIVAFSPNAYYARSPFLHSRTALFSAPINTAAVNDFELPDVSEILEKIQLVSPLAQCVMDNNACVHDRATSQDPQLKWTTVEANKKSAVKEIQKLDRFDGISVPVFRFRSSLKGPCIGEFFGRFIMDLDERRKWDAQIENVHEIHNINNVHVVNQGLDQARFGTCARLGVGYGQTKKSFGITPREQMFLYGMQEFPDGSSVIWGTEMSDEYNHMLPPGQRHTRSRSHLFSATLKPTGKDTFDIEYVLQLDIGGSIPTWLTTPVLIDTVKKLFETLQREFAGATDGLHRFLQEKMEQDKVMNWQSLLQPV